MKRFFRNQLFAFLATVLPLWLIILNARFRVVSPEIMVVCLIVTFLVFGGTGIWTAVMDKEVSEIISTRDSLVIGTVVYAAGGVYITPFLVVGLSKPDALLFITGLTVMIACAYVYATWATKRAYEQKSA